MIYFIGLIILLLPSYLVRFSILGIPTTLLEILIYVALVITLALKIKNKELKPRAKSLISDYKLLIPIILFLVAGLISIFISPDKREALGLFKANIFDPIVFFFVILVNLDENNKSNAINLWFKALIISGVLVAIYAIYQKLIGELTPDGRVVGIFGYSPNYLALYLAPILTLAFALETSIADGKYDFNSYKKVWFYDFAWLVILIGIWLSGSRAGIGAAIIGMASFLVMRHWSWIKSKKIFVLFFYLSIVILMVVGWQIVKPDWGAAANSGRISSSNNIRWEIWKTTIKDVIPHNLVWLKGVGLGNYQNNFTELTKNRVNYPEWVSPYALTPHNIFLTIWINLGLLGLIAFVWLIYLFFKFAKNKASSYNLILVAVMATIIVQGLVDSPYWKNDLALMFWIILAMAFPFNKKQNE